MALQALTDFLQISEMFQNAQLSTTKFSQFLGSCAPYTIANTGEVATARPVAPLQPPTMTSLSQFISDSSFALTIRPLVGQRSPVV